MQQSLVVINRLNITHSVSPVAILEPLPQTAGVATAYNASKLA